MTQHCFTPGIFEPIPASFLSCSLFPTTRYIHQSLSRLGSQHLHDVDSTLNSLLESVAKIPEVLVVQQAYHLGSQPLKLFDTLFYLLNILTKLLVQLLHSDVSTRQKYAPHGFCNWLFRTAFLCVCQRCNQPLLLPLRFQLYCDESQPDAIHFFLRATTPASTFFGGIRFLNVLILQWRNIFLLANLAGQTSLTETRSNITNKSMENASLWYYFFYHKPTAYWASSAAGFLLICSAHHIGSPNITQMWR